MLKGPGEYSMEVAVLPKSLLRTAVGNDFAGVKNSLDGEIDGFVDSLLNGRRQGDVPRIFLPRDYFSEHDLNWLRHYFGDSVLHQIPETSTNLRKMISGKLLAAGVQTMTEEGVLTPRDKDPETSDFIDSMKWADLDGGTRASKVNRLEQFDVMTGMRPRHRNLQDEVIYRLSDPGIKMFGRYALPYSRDVRFYLSVTEPVRDKKTLADCIDAIWTESDVEKVMLNLIKAIEGVYHLHKNSLVHRDVKSDNIFEDGIVFDNLSVIEAWRSIFSDVAYGTVEYMPCTYLIEWPKKPDAYYDDIFAFAVCMMEILSSVYGNRAFDVLKWFSGFDNCGHYLNRSGKFKLDHFVETLKNELLDNCTNEKFIKAWAVIEKMIRGLGKYTLADALRELEGIFGSGNRYSVQI